MLWKISFTFKVSASLSALTNTSSIVRVRLHKEKEAVNPITAAKLRTRKLAVPLRAILFLICLSAIQPAYSGEKKNAYLLAVLSDNNYTVLQRQDTGRAAPVDSLLKPFAAWYLLEKGVPAHQNVFCPPEKKRHELLRCWTPNGHGAVDLAAALVQSGKKPYDIALVVLEHIPRKEKILLLCYELEKTGSGAALAAPAILSRYAREIRKSKNLRR